MAFNERNKIGIDPLERSERTVQSDDVDQRTRGFGQLVRKVGPGEIAAMLARSASPRMIDEDLAHRS